MPSSANSDARPSRGRALGLACRLGWRAFALCLALALVGQLLSGLLAGRPSGLTFGERLLGAVLSSSLLGSFVCGLSFVVLAASPGQLLPRRLAIGLASLVATLVLSLHVLSTVLTVMLGSRPTSSGIAFFMNSTEHLGAAIAKQYVVHALLVLLGAALIAALSGLWFRGVFTPAAAHEQKPADGRSWAGRSCFAMAVLVVVALILPVSSQAFARSGALRATPELIFLGSLEMGREASLENSPLVIAALGSSLQTDMDPWQEVARAVTDRPNVVIVMLESVAISHVGYLGYPREVTPNLDRIAEQSLRARRAYTTATHSNYAQMAAISSLFPRRGRSLDMYHRIDYPRALQHDVLGSLGRISASVSSQDETWQGMMRFQTTKTETHFHHAQDHQGEKLDMVTEDIIPDDATVSYAIEWLEDQPSDQPVSLYLNLQSTHFPYPLPKYAPRPFLPDEPQSTFNYVTWSESDRTRIENRYDNALSFVDAQLGRLVDALEESGRLDNTVLVVTADHGELFFEHGLVTHGRSLHEGEVRVPLLVHYPAVLEPGDLEAPVSTLDILPTVLDLLGHPAHPLHQGTSFARLREEPTTERSGVFFNIQGWKHAQGLVCGMDKLIYDPDSDTAQLFDLAADPSETTDLSGKRPDRTQKLTETLAAQMTAQDIYHEATRRGTALRRERFAPRMLRCPVEADR